MTLALLAAGADAGSLRNRIAALLAPEGVKVLQAPCALPEAWEPVVVLVVLSPAALADPALLTFIEDTARRGLPLVPVVEELAAYDFSRVAPSPLAERNTVGWQPGEGQAILQAVRAYLGREAFPDRKKVFISYRRDDGQAFADRIYKDLWNHKFEAFLDVYQLEAGAEVQKRIYEQMKARTSCSSWIHSWPAPPAGSRRRSSRP